ncbi:cupin domain-containing protein [Bacillus sp. Marseille-P3661]|uniref:cupin domain-containing protein n=1 Tax=Bacillus sp. Marseille-P3661 TaxID=1936234 RepID=UPI000C84DD8F|nr:cupin domain-containing protein [Bacillus sp. Marseille-P3661]
MAIKIVDMIKMANDVVGTTQDTNEVPGAIRKVLMNGPKFHTWLHVYQNPGDHDEMHCHNADQTFYCVEGECTMYFKDDSAHVLKPGMVALIPGGNFYWLENTGESKMVLLGSRALSDEESQKIDFVTRKNVHAHKMGEPPKYTKILVD